jgi:high-affinity Fe2+/Pb2+ permease
MHKLTVVATAVIAAIVAFWVLSSLVGIIAFLIKAVVVVAVIGGVLYLVVRHAGRH